jgi:uncharacterized membrane protein
MSAAGLVMILGIPGVLPRAFLLVCFLLLLVVFWAIGWRDVRVDLARMRGPSEPDSS